ncbi:hypothetical protein [Natrinema sp. DC36]|uniref:hypothetical protein n=1 Tax=Natrinema sp. DC36 TaxID=2878680 RepID=UPI001CF07BC4|nr:hypothetical protein [Natrinema sp. DC36]
MCADRWPVGGAIGLVVGPIVGYALQHATRTSNITVVCRDRDACRLGLCAPGIRPYVSSVWMDQNTDLLRVDNVDEYCEHVPN